MYYPISKNQTFSQLAKTADLLGSGQKIKGGVGWRKRGVGQQVFSLRQGVGHPIFEPLEGVGHNSFWLGII